MIDQYSHFWFDADETLFKFDAYAGLQHMFQMYDVEFTKEHFEVYQATNKPLWVAYQDGLIDANTLQITRFKGWADKLSVEPSVLNEQFLDSMALLCEPLPGALGLIDYLKSKQKSLSIITNGFTALQERRLQKTGLRDAFDHIVISEQIGYAKPHSKVFEHTMAKHGLTEQDKPHILMVGDTLASDILGGNNAGIDTVWLNHHNIEVEPHVMPTYEVPNLEILLRKLKGRN
ncbi:pyrimidine 5'-nucleotidase [Rhodanobacter aciditrophus]|uniref:Pyrimidine 5'-nucleotidase n=1 Tax=Rhodanobacter aciditrophus TaxID=1623218 RepID=A0ABW4B0S8_9GAMM